MLFPTTARDDNYVLTLEEISQLAQESGKPAETLMNVVALIARRFETDVCSAYLLDLSGLTRIIRPIPLKALGSCALPSGGRIVLLD